jgi:hypothetical protein
MPTLEKSDKPLRIQIWEKPSKEKFSFKPEKVHLSELEVGLINKECNYAIPTKKKKPNISYLKIMQGERYIKEGGFKKAEIIFNGLTNAGSEEVVATAYGWLINLSYWRGQYDSCERYIKELVEKIPRTKKSGKTLLRHIKEIK